MGNYPISLTNLSGNRTCAIKATPNQG